MRLNRARVIPGRGCVFGVVGHAVPVLPCWTTVRKLVVSRSSLESGAVDGESPVGENCWSVECVPE
jgi:hypothetical protein